MPKTKQNHHRNLNKNYRKQTFGKSVFDDNPTLTIHRYHVPNAYFDAVKTAITAFKNGIPFNKAVDQVAALYPNTINRNKLAEHTLKYIANDY